MLLIKVSSNEESCSMSVPVALYHTRSADLDLLGHCSAIASSSSQMSLAILHASLDSGIRDAGQTFEPTAVSSRECAVISTSSGSCDAVSGITPLSFTPLKYVLSLKTLSLTSRLTSATAKCLITNDSAMKREHTMSHIRLLVGEVDIVRYASPFEDRISLVNAESWNSAGHFHDCDLVSQSLRRRGTRAFVASEGIWNDPDVIAIFQLNSAFTVHVSSRVNRARNGTPTLIVSPSEPYTSKLTYINPLLSIQFRTSKSPFFVLSNPATFSNCGALTSRPLLSYVQPW